MKIVVYDGEKIAKFHNGKDVKEAVRQFCLFIQRKYGFRIIDVLRR